MGRRGWGGSPPADDDDARKRIVEAAVRCVERHGARHTTLSAVAVDLEITRRTVYRYFASIDDLFSAVAEIAFDSWVSQLEAATSHLENPSDLLVESVAYIIEKLPNEPLLTLLLTSGRTEQFSRRMLEPHAIVTCRSILLSSRVDWRARGWSDAQLDEIVELCLRIIQSMMIAPPVPSRTGAQQRAFLRRWIGPAIDARGPKGHAR